MDFDDFQLMELCEALGLNGDVRTFEVVEAVKNRKFAIEKCRIDQALHDIQHELRDANEKLRMMKKAVTT